MQTSAHSRLIHQVICHIINAMHNTLSRLEIKVTVVIVWHLGRTNVSSRDTIRC